MVVCLIENPADKKFKEFYEGILHEYKKLPGASARKRG